MYLWRWRRKLGCILIAALIVPVSGRPLQSTQATTVEMPFFSSTTGQTFGALEIASTAWVPPRLGPFSVGALRRLTVSEPVLRLDLAQMSGADMRTLQEHFSALGESAARLFRDCRWELRDARHTVALRTRSLRQLSPDLFLLVPEGAVAAPHGPDFEADRIWVRIGPDGLQLVFLSPPAPPRKVTLQFGLHDENTAP
jgi:hypothetical protein